MIAYHWPLVLVIVVMLKLGTTHEHISNPYMGFAPPADGGPYAQPHSLVYANFSWRELEPKKGFYDFSTIEQKYKLDYWKQQNVKLIFRVVLDYPSKTKDKDIPDWLYEEINQEGTWYEHDWGSGFSPNYSHAKLIFYHEQLIQALAERYNHDPAIAFIQLGSVGHWGEWHTLQQDDIHIPFPELPVAETYVNHYLKYFDQKILLMRRPHQIAIDHGLGLYNDMFGRVDHTLDEFWSWVEDGYQFWLTEEHNPPMPNYWQYAPTGGEFAPTTNWEDYFSILKFPGVMRQLNLTHVSWLGPSSPASYPLDGKIQKRINLFLNKMGYHFRLKKVSYPQKVKQGSLVDINMVWQNRGVAPFYFPWPLELSLINKAGEIVYQQIVDTDIRAWLPGKHKVQEKLYLPPSLPEGDYTLGTAILDPENMEPGIKLEMTGGRPDGRYTIGKLRISKRTK